MKIYLAARYSRRDELREYRKVLEEKGHTVTSSWLNEDLPLNVTMADITPEFNRETAWKDLADINAADVFLMFSEDPLSNWPRGGRHFESGYAFAQRKEMVTVGPKENIFHYLPGMYNYETFEKAVDELEAIEEML